MSSGDGPRIHRLIQELLDQPEPERQGWLARTLPDDSQLRARLIAAVGDREGPERGGNVAFAFEAVGPRHAAIPAKIGRYEIRERLGYGGMGVLYLAVDPALNRLVAVKLLRFNVDEMHERFTREAHAAARLDHRNIVTIFDVGEHEGQPFIAMEFIAGETLGELIRRRAPLPLAQKIRLVADLCDGLAWAHKAGIIHRDVKPANVMVTHDGTLKIIDFGIARLVDSGMTQTRGVVGTPNYMSPEQLEGRTADHLSDMFCVGLVMYELLSSRRAFPGEVQHVVATNILTAEPRPLAELVPEIDPDLVHVVTRALRKRPEDRYPDLTAMGADLMRVVTRVESASTGKSVIGDGHDEVTATPSDSMKGWRLLKRFRPAFAAAAVVGVVVSVITVVATLWWQPLVEPTVSFAPTSEVRPAGAPPVTEPVAPVPRIGPNALDAVIAAPQPASAGPSTPPVARGEASSAVANRIAILIKEAEALRLRREYDAAIARYLEALGLAPQDDEARAGLRETRTAKKRAEEALVTGPSPEPSRSVSSADTEAERLVGLALKTSDANDDATTPKALEEALRVNPRNESAPEPATTVERAPSAPPVPERTPPVVAATNTSGPTTSGTVTSAPPRAENPAPMVVPLPKPAEETKPAAPVLIAVVDPKVGIGSALNSYRDAYQSMDINALLKVYPKFAGTKDLENKLEDLKEVAMALGNATIQYVSDVSATAICTYSLTYTSKTGKVENTRPMRAEFKLARSGVTWLIESIQFK